MSRDRSLPCALSLVHQLCFCFQRKDNSSESENFPFRLLLANCLSQSQSMCSFGCYFLRSQRCGAEENFHEVDQQSPSKSKPVSFSLLSCQVQLVYCNTSFTFPLLTEQFLHSNRTVIVTCLQIRSPNISYQHLLIL